MFDGRVSRNLPRAGHFAIMAFPRVRFHKGSSPHIRVSSGLLGNALAFSVRTGSNSRHRRRPADWRSGSVGDRSPLRETEEGPPPPRSNIIACELDEKKRRRSIRGNHPRSLSRWRVFDRGRRPSKSAENVSPIRARTKEGTMNFTRFRLPWRGALTSPVESCEAARCGS